MEQDNNRLKCANFSHCISSYYIIFIITPFIISMVLYFWKPEYLIKRTYRGTKKFDKVKLFKTTIVLTLLVWIFLWLCSKNGSFKDGIKICSFSN